MPSVLTKDPTFVGPSVIPVQTRHLAIPGAAHVYAATDLHGCLDVVKKTCDLIEQDIAQKALPSRLPIYFVVMGDLIDKGPDTREAIDYLAAFEKKMSGTHRFRTIHLMGNHEKWLIDFVNGPQDKNYHEWMRNAQIWLSRAGGWSTLQSYGVAPPDNIKAGIDLVKNEMFDHAAIDAIEYVRDELLKSKSLQRHLPHYAGLGATAQWKHFVFCHAQIAPGKTVEEHSVDDVIQGRRLVNYGGRFTDDVVVVFGHSSGQNPPLLNPNCIGIDPCAIKYHKSLVLNLAGNGHARFLRDDGVTAETKYARHQTPMPSSTRPVFLPSPVSSSHGRHGARDYYEQLAIIRDRMQLG